MRTNQIASRRSGSRFERLLYSLYVRWIRPHVQHPIHRQRLKLPLFGLGYRPLLFLRTVPWIDRLRMIARFLRVDWHVVHGHRPCEIARVVAALSERPAQDGEIVVEAGCWRGGSTAKFSIACKILGYRLHVYDSFEGVMRLTPEEREEGYDYSGEYSAPESLVRYNVRKYGELGVCSFRKGWFAETLARNPLRAPVRAVYIDCDVARGTEEVLLGTLPALVPDGRIFSQDYHIKSVRALLHAPGTWSAFGRGTPQILYLCGNLASLRFGA